MCSRVSHSLLIKNIPTYIEYYLQIMGIFTCVKNMTYILIGLLVTPELQFSFGAYLIVCANSHRKLKCYKT